MSGISDSAKFNDESSYYQPANGNTVSGVSALNFKAGALSLASADNSVNITSGGASIIDFSTSNTVQNPASVNASGAVQGNTLVATTSVTSVSASIGVAVINSVKAKSVISGSFTGVLAVGASVNILQVATPCYVEVLVTANPKAGQGDSRYGYQCFIISPALDGGGNLFLGANTTGLPSALFRTAINATNGSGGTPTAYGTPVAINLGSVSGGGASQSFVGSYRVMSLPDALATYSGPIASQTINYVIP